MLEVVEKQERPPLPQNDVELFLGWGAPVCRRGNRLRYSSEKVPGVPHARQWREEHPVGEETRGLRGHGEC